MEDPVVLLAASQISNPTRLFNPPPMQCLRMTSTSEAVEIGLIQMGLGPECQTSPGKSTTQERTTRLLSKT